MPATLHGSIPLLDLNSGERDRGSSSSTTRLPANNAELPPEEEKLERQQQQQPPSPPERRKRSSRPNSLPLGSKVSESGAAAAAASGTTTSAATAASTPAAKAGFEATDSVKANSLLPDNFPLLRTKQQQRQQQLLLTSPASKRRRGGEKIEENGAGEKEKEFERPAAAYSSSSSQAAGGRDGDVVAGDNDVTEREEGNLVAKVKRMLRIKRTPVSPGKKKKKKKMEEQAKNKKKRKRLNSISDKEEERKEEGAAAPIPRGVSGAQHDTALEDKDDSVIDVEGEEDGGGEHSNSRLFKVVMSDHETDTEELSSPGCEQLDKTNEENKVEKLGLFARSSNLMSSVRSSLRKSFRGFNNRPKSGSELTNNATNLEGDVKDEAEEVTLEDIENRKKNKKRFFLNKESGGSNVGGVRNARSAGEGGGCNDSQDSGLGEDSDYFDPTLRDSSLLSSSISPRSPTPGGQLSSRASSGIIRPSSSNLRKVSSSTSSSCHSSAAAGNHNLSSSAAILIKKHVMIREPSLTHLPSSQRQSRSEEKVIRVRGTRLETVVIYPKPTRVPTVALRTLSVSSQWGQLYQMAAGEVLKHVQGVDPYSVSLIFEADKDNVRNEVQDMQDVSSLVYTVYKVLFFEWFEWNETSHLAIVVHCVQACMIIIVDVADSFQSSAERRRLAKSCRDLKRSCEASKYQHLPSCLDHTRRTYIDLWCTLLALPPYEGRNGSTCFDLSLNQVRERISLSREREIPMMDA